MKFKNFLNESNILNPTDVQWQKPNYDARSFGDMARRSLANQQYQAGNRAIESLKYVIRSIWGNATEYGASISGAFPNAIIDVPKNAVVRSPSLGTANPRQVISEIELNFYKQQGMLTDNGTNLRIFVKKVYDYIPNHEMARTHAADAADQFIQGVTSGADPNVRNWRYPNQ